jgi:phosphatidylserine decarboxylase
MKAIKQTTTEYIAVEGYVPVGASAIITLLAHYENFGHITQVILFAITIALIWFFRNPERISLDDSQDAILSPVDGVIESIDTTNEHIYITIHTKLKDAHIIRAPLKSKLIQASVRHGAFLSVDSDKAALLNESYVTTWESENNEEYSISFTLGSSPAKIALYTALENSVRAGERISFVKSEIKTVIKFSKNIKFNLSPSDKVLAGQSVIGYERNTTK